MPTQIVMSLANNMTKKEKVGFYESTNQNNTILSKSEPNTIGNVSHVKANVDGW